MYKEKIEDVLKILETSENGLSSQEAKKRLIKYGPNEILEKKTDSWLKIFGKQFINFMSIILTIAGILAIIFGIITKNNEEKIINFIEAGVIFLILIINGLIGTIQEYNASQTLKELKKIGALTSKVLREGKISIINTNDLVIGDIVLIEDGSIIPADLRLLHSSSLQIQESSLTGESIPVEKEAKWIGIEEVGISEQLNMCFSSTIVVYGNGIGIVVKTGIKTEIGKIANALIEEKSPQTHIEKSMNKIGKILTYVGAIAALIVIVLGFFKVFLVTKTNLWTEPILVAVSVAVSVIPEGLPTMASVLMAMGVKKMAKKNALVKKLPSVETLGCCTCICCDKTGTLTLNQITLAKLVSIHDIIKGKEEDLINLDNEKNDNKNLKFLLKIGLLCNNGEIDEKGGLFGDPTETALLKGAEKFSLNYKEIKKENKRVFELPFDSFRKMMSVVCESNEKRIIYTKGALDELLSICKTYIDKEGKKQNLTPEIIQKIKEKNISLSQNALRVLGYAFSDISSEISLDSNIENNLTFVGMSGMIDPPRLEVKEAVKQCYDAGLKVVMITGDHGITAKAIAKELLIFKDNDQIMNGDELDKISDEELVRRIENITVFSRISPTGKMRIVKALQKNNEIVSMTGDGVNDAPSLKAANIGVSMGISGTDVAKSSSDLILLDDNFATIGKAVFEGRRIFRNIQKVIQFLVSGCIAEVLIIVFYSVISVFPHLTINNHEWHEVLNPIQILTLNLVTDTIPCIALGMDELSIGSYKKKPQEFKNLFSRSIIYNTAMAGLWISIISIVGYIIGNAYFDNEYAGMTIAFITLSFSQTVHAFNMQSNSISMFSKQNKFNKWIPILSFSSLFIVVIMVFISKTGGKITEAILGIDTEFDWWVWVVMILISLSIIPFLELLKFFERRKMNRTNHII
ncbi:MAG: cation-translocating P-type ATPase [Mycoplasmataceae bacterium]|nr:cation-translocating P-type ATPase [Mycoplasmataceae bacterium]